MCSELICCFNCRHMKHLIQQVKQLKNKRNTFMENHKEKNVWAGHINQVPIINVFNQLNNQYSPHLQPPQTSFWPTMLHPTTLKTFEAVPHFNCKNYT